MKQKEARRIAKAASEGTGEIYIADTVRWTVTDRLIRGGYTHPDQFWVVFRASSGRIVYPAELRNILADPDPQDFEAKLRETEKDIARALRDNPIEPGGMTPDDWEGIRQWPGEFHEDDADAEDDGHDEWCPADCDKSHLKPQADLLVCDYGTHVAERCEHGETKRTCGHGVDWSRYRVRTVPCAPSFCCAAAGYHA